MEKIAELIKEKFETTHFTEITLISVHGIETKISKEDKIIGNPGTLHIVKDECEMEIISYADPIFKFVFK